MAASSVRACPLCRVPCHFIIPSPVTPRTPEEKALIVDTYKASLSRIPCRHFVFGKVECPFGNSCFYAHLKPDGTRAEPEVLRVRVGAEGETDVVRDAKLSDVFR